MHTQGNWTPWRESAKAAKKALNSAKNLDTKIHMSINIYIYSINIMLHMVKEEIQRRIKSL